jgi:hypothetical protein
MSKKTAPQKKTAGTATSSFPKPPVAEPEPLIPDAGVPEPPQEPAAVEETPGPLAAMPPSDQELAYDAIASEIECQRLGYEVSDEPDTLAEYILAFESAVEDLRASFNESRAGAGFCDNPLGEVRRIGALAVRCMEKNGAPTAEMTNAMKLNLLEELAGQCPEGCGLDPAVIAEILDA